MATTTKIWKEKKKKWHQAKAAKASVAELGSDNWFKVISAHMYWGKVAAGINGNRHNRVLKYWTKATRKMPLVAMQHNVANFVISAWNGDSGCLCFLASSH